MDKIVSDSITPQVPGFYRIPQICQEYSGAREYWLNLSSDSTTMQALWFYFFYLYKMLQICPEYSPPFFEKNRGSMRSTF